MTVATPGKARNRPASAIEVLLAFAKLGVSCFGGPIVHIDYFRQEFVVRRGWLDEHTYAELTRGPTRDMCSRRSLDGVGLLALVTFFVLLAGLPILSAVTHPQAVALFEAFYRSGALVFGGGHVVLPCYARPQSHPDG
jgi:hypothetical protein